MLMLQQGDSQERLAGGPSGAQVPAALCCVASQFDHCGSVQVEEGDFLEIVTQAQRVVVHFYHRDFERCKLLDKHLQVLARKYFDTRFIKLSAPVSVSVCCAFSSQPEHAQQAHVLHNEFLSAGSGLHEGPVAALVMPGGLHFQKFRPGAGEHRLARMPDWRAFSGYRDQWRSPGQACHDDVLCRTRLSSL